MGGYGGIRCWWDRLGVGMGRYKGMRDATAEGLSARGVGVSSARPRFRPRLRRVVFAVASVVIAVGCGLMGAELLCRVANIAPAPPAERWGWQDANSEYVVPHAVYHHWHSANFSGRMYQAVEGVSAQNTTNSLGMRDRERSFEKPAGVVRIAVLGDSFVEASLVGDEQTATRMLEKSLVGSCGSVEVLNFGCSSFSPLLGVRLYEHLVRRFRPDVVFYFFHQTDFRDDAEYGGVGSGSGVAWVGVPRYWDNPKWGRLGRVVRMQLYARELASFPVGPVALDRYATFKLPEELTREDRDTMSFTFDQIGVLEGMCRSDGAEFALVAVPSPDQVRGQDYSIGAGFVPLRREMAGRTTMQEMLAGGMGSRGIRYLDLREALTEYSEGHENAQLYYQNDGHWNAEGQQAVARVLESWMDGRKLLRRR